MAGPLAGLRVVELGGIGPVPHAGMVLADLGADVVRIQRPGGGLDTGPPDRDVLLRGCRLRSADLSTPAGVADVLAEIAAADVLVEGFRPGVAERLHVATGVALVGPVDSPVRVGPGQSHQWLSDREHLFQAEGPDPAVGVLLISHPPAEAAPPPAGRSGAGDENRTRVISLED